MTPKAYIIKDKNKFYFNKEQSTEWGKKIHRMGENTKKWCFW
jgi:hypothetical protein